MFVPHRPEKINIKSREEQVKAAQQKQVAPPAQEPDAPAKVKPAAPAKGGSRE